MNELEALRYLYAQHKVIASAAHRGNTLAQQIVAANQQRDYAALQRLAVQWQQR